MDKELHEAMGSEFYGSTALMSANFKADRLDAVVNRLMQLTTLEMPRSMEKAYLEAGGKKAKETSGGFEESVSQQVSGEPASPQPAQDRGTPKAVSGQERRGVDTEAARTTLKDLAKIDRQAAQQTLTNFRGHWRKHKGKTYGALGGRQITAIFGELFDKFVRAGVLGKNPVRVVDHLNQGMQTTRNTIVHAASEIDRKWARLFRKDRRTYHTMNRLMGDVTTSGIDPTAAYVPLHDMDELQAKLKRARSDATRQRLQEQITEEAERKQDYFRLQDIWKNGLSQDARDLYKEVEQFYKNQREAQRKALVARAEALFEPREAADAIQQIKKKFTDLQGPYFPLQRFGDYFVKGIDRDGKEYREHFASEPEKIEAMKQLQDSGMTITEDGKLEPYKPSDNAGVMNFVVALEKRLLAKGSADPLHKAKLQFMDELHQTAIALLPETSAAKRSMHRRNIAGFDANMRQAFNQTALTGANRQARIEYGWKIEQALERMREAVRGNAKTKALTVEENHVAQDVITELALRHEKNMNPQGSPLAAWAVNASFFMYMGGSIGAGLVNMTQTPMLALPIMGSRFGFGKTTRYMAKASRDFFGKGLQRPKDAHELISNAWFSLENNTRIEDDARKALEALVNDGTVEITQAAVMAGNSAELDDVSGKTRDWANTLSRGTGMFFHNAEVANRQITALTAYRLKRDQLLKKSKSGKLTPEQHTSAVDFARWATLDAHFDYSSYNRPRYMKGNWAKVFFIFKQYAQNMTVLLGKTLFDAFRKVPKGLSDTEKKAFTDARWQAKKQLYGILGMSTLFSGVMGLPGMWFAKWLAEAIGGDEDDPMDAESAFREWAAPLFGKQNAHALSKGVFNGYLGIDLHSRTKLNDLIIPSSNRDLEGRQRTNDAILQAAGPFFSILGNSAQGLSEILNGESWRGTERLMPKFIRDGMRSVRYSDEGLLDTRGNVMIEDFNPFELAMRGVGLGTARESEAWSARNAVNKAQYRITKRRNTLLNDYDKARREGDYHDRQQVMERIGGFNALQQVNHRPWAMISGDTLAQSTRMREQRRRKTERGIYIAQPRAGLRDIAEGYMY